MILNGKILLRGKGLHSGLECELTIEPCDSPTILLSSGTNELPVSELALCGTNRGSDYKFPDGTTIRTCEHVFSALYGMGIYSGVRVTVKGGEMPALDGCSRTVCDELLKHSSQAQAKTDILTLKSPAIVYGTDPTRYIAAFPYDRLRITCIVEYDYIGSQVFEYVQDSGSYYEEISRARTFAMRRDIDYLLAHGMALGGSLDNAIVVGEKIEASGGLHWPDEFVRHKVLDLLGDLAAVGHPVNAHIIAVKAGHELHLKLSERLREETHN